MFGGPLSLILRVPLLYVVQGLHVVDSLKPSGFNRSRAFTIARLPTTT